MENKIYELYPNAPLQLVGIKFAKCNRQRKLILLSGISDLEYILKTVKQGCIVIVSIGSTSQRRSREQRVSDEPSHTLTDRRNREPSNQIRELPIITDDVVSCPEFVIEENETVSDINVQIPSRSADADVYLINIDRYVTDNTAFYDGSTI